MNCCGKEDLSAPVVEEVINEEGFIGSGEQGRKPNKRAIFSYQTRTKRSWRHPVLIFVCSDILKQRTRFDMHGVVTWKRWRC